MTQTKIYNQDCTKKLQKLIQEEVKVDLILTDPPYGTTANNWDKIIPYTEMWTQLKQIIKPNGIIAIFSTQPYTTQLIHSNIKMYRYSWIWDKKTSSNFLNCNYQPLKRTEDINIFSNGTIGSKSRNPIRYNPQNIKKINKKKKNNPNSKYRKQMGYNTNNNIINSNKEYTQKYTNYPTNIITFPKDKNNTHPTQKPVALLEYLIRTYTDENELVLDFTMGTGSTGVACQNTNRNFIGIEINKKYFDIAEKRLKENKNKLI